MTDKKIISFNPNLNNFKIYKTLEVGVSLTGGETKSIRLFGINLRGAVVVINDKGVFLVGAKIQPYFYAGHQNENRNLPLLLHKKQINYLFGKATDKFLIIPTKAYWLGSKIKIEVAVVQKLKKWQKKEKLKRKDLDREQERQLKNFKTVW